MTPTGAPEAAGGLVVLGEVMGLLSPPVGRALVHSSSVDVSIAGAESNVAIGVRRLGVPARVVTRLGDDPFGDLVRRTLAAEQVRCTAVSDPGRPTGLMLKEHRRRGLVEAHYHRRGSAASAMGPQEVAAVVAEPAAVLHVTGITAALGDGAAEVVAAASSAASSAGTAVSFDVNHRSRLWSAERAREPLLGIARRCDVLFASGAEAELLLGDRPRPRPARDLVRELADLTGCSEVVLTLGAAGAVGTEDGEVLEVGARAVEVVDTVGAGDAFVAGYLVERLGGSPLGVRLDTATRAGAAACTSSSDWQGFPRRAELDAVRDDEVVR